MITNCACGSGKDYGDCCKKIHSNIKNALTAEQLMRSRYTAFTMANGDYLMESHHKTTRPIKEKKVIEDWARSVNWIRLEIVNTSKGTEKDKEGTVTFKAFYFEAGSVQLIEENSRFVRENGVWLYLGKN